MPDETIYIQSIQRYILSLNGVIREAEGSDPIVVLPFIVEGTLSEIKHQVSSIIDEHTKYIDVPR